MLSTSQVMNSAVVALEVLLDHGLDFEWLAFFLMVLNVSVMIWDGQFILSSYFSFLNRVSCY